MHRVTRRTIFRDLEELKKIGVPYLYDAKTHSYSISPGFFLPPINLNHKAGSRLSAAGNMARVWEWQEPNVHGFSFRGHSTAIAGDWFVIDYTATNVGVCKVGFYDHAISWVDPIYYLTFFHVPSRDFNSDTKVDRSYMVCTW